MVLALVLLARGGADPAGHAPPGHAPPGHAPCRLLYARTFGTPPGIPPGTPDPPGAPARRRLRRKEQLMAVARQVASQCWLPQPSLGLPLSPPVPEEPLALQDAPGGVFQLPPGDPFPEPVTVTWLSAPALAFALVCDPRENVALAQLTLRRLATRLAPLLAPGAPLLLRPDAADLVLRRLLPHGRLLFLNERCLQALDREMGNKGTR
ncbi:AP-5 complex subunit sigma-1 [Nyctibius grandis]|uniref:AP-5 complex subunit sigma-1 n=1 Tax=Nyctibius grandis TaxID=48427 RepID=UPI0035BC45F4